MLLLHYYSGVELHGGTGVVGPRQISSKSRGNHYLVLFISVVDPGAECIGPRRQKFLASPLLLLIGSFAIYVIKQEHSRLAVTDGWC